MSKQDRSDDGGAPLFERPLDRRAFLGLSAAGGAAFLLAACGGGDEDEAAAPPPAAEPAPPAAEPAEPPPAEPPAITGNTPAERAIAGIKALNLPPDFTITVFTEDLSILGPEVTKAKFEQESGIKLDVQKAPYLEYAAKVFNDATTKAGTFDVILMETNRLGDLDNAGYLTDVTDWVEKYDPDLEEMVPPVGRVSSIYNGKYVGIPTDGDVFIFYYRKDLLEDPSEQEAFKAKYGRDLAVPLTYDEYNEVLEFFTRPDEGLFGAVEWRIKGVNYWWFWQRLWSGGGTYFNDDGSAAINSEAGIKALEDMKAMSAYMPKDALSYAARPSRTSPGLPRARTSMTLRRPRPQGSGAMPSCRGTWSTARPTRSRWPPPATRSSSRTPRRRTRRCATSIPSGTRALKTSSRRTRTSRATPTSSGSRSSLIRR